MTVRGLSKEEMTAAFLKACQERPADVAAAIKALYAEETVIPDTARDALAALARRQGKAG